MQSNQTKPPRSLESLNTSSIGKCIGSGEGQPVRRVVPTTLTASYVFEVMKNLLQFQSGGTLYPTTPMVVPRRWTPYLTLSSFSKKFGAKPKRSTSTSTH